ncbi:MAG: Dyp-type peroxidase [Dermabacter sp.]|nr:Dyp-type peroxidase [Dermabacter sp.]
MSEQSPDAAPTPDPAPGGERESTAGISRRGALGIAGAAAAAGAGVGAVAMGMVERRERADEAGADGALTSRTYDLRGEHQQGVTTPAQDNLYIAAFDLTTTSRDDVVRLLQEWLVAAEQMSRGELVGGRPVEGPHVVPRDTGEAWNYPPSSLTITVGVGRGLFVDGDGNDRFGLKDRMPQVLDVGLPRFANEALVDAQSYGDLVVQACADDAQVASHAIRNLTRIAFGTATLRWTQQGFGRTSSTSVAQETPRNLFGFKDGTRNIKAEDSPDEQATHLWVQDGDDPAADWLAGGTYLVFRKIRMFLEVWDRLRLIEQEQTMGRDKEMGAPLSVTAPTAQAEFADPDFEATASEETATGGVVRAGNPLIPVDSHVHVVAPENNDGARMLRRGYNYAAGNDSLGRLDSGLMFIAFVRDPRAGFYPILDRMTKDDALTEYLQHTATGVFAVLPGVGPTARMFGESLVEDR